jgi:hypothetical protein
MIRATLPMTVHDEWAAMSYLIGVIEDAGHLEDPAYEEIVAAVTRMMQSYELRQIHDVLPALEAVERLRARS